MTRGRQFVHRCQSVLRVSASASLVCSSLLLKSSAEIYTAISKFKMRICALFMFVCVLAQGHDKSRLSEEERALRLLLEKTLGKLDRAYSEGRTDPIVTGSHGASTGTPPPTSTPTSAPLDGGTSPETRAIGDDADPDVETMTVNDDAVKVSGGAQYGQWHQAYTSSNCDFLINILDDYILNHIPVDAVITDYFDVDLAEVRAQLPDLEVTMKTVQDPEILAFTFTKKLTAIVLDTRMLCPATLFDIITVHVMINEMDLMFEDEKGSLVDGLQAVLARFPTTRSDPYLAASQMATQTHGRVFNDSIHFLMGTGLQDVAVFSRRLFQALKGMFQLAPQLMDTPSYRIEDRFDSVVQEQIYMPDTHLHCPTAEFTMQRFRDAAYDFIHGVESIETAEVCMEARDYIENFSPHDGPMTGASIDWSLYTEDLMTICGYVLEYIHAVMSAMKTFDTLMMDQDTRGMKELFQRHLSVAELKFLTKVLEHLKWVPLLPEEDEEDETGGIGGTGGAGGAGNYYIPADKVITHSKEDMKYLQNLLASLTKESFSQMTFGDLRNMIKAWMTGKQKQVDEYDHCKMMMGENGDGGGH